MRNIFSTLLLSVLVIFSNAQTFSLDSTFGKNGLAASAVHENEIVYGLEVMKIFPLTDGKVLTVLRGGSSVLLSRFLADGKPDSTYCKNGYSDVLDLAAATCAARQQDGKVLIVGRNFTPPFKFKWEVLRYNADGTIDKNFGTQGKQLIDFGYAEQNPVDISILPDGKIIIAGTIIKISNTYNAIGLARLTSHGDLDETFGQEGKLISDLGTSTYVGAATVQPDGKILVAGNQYVMNNANVILVRYNANGSMDSTFGSYGSVVADIPGNQSANDLKLDSEKRIVIGAVTASGPFETAMTVIRCNEFGFIDYSFNNSGFLTTTFGRLTNTLETIEIQNDNKIVAGGYVREYDSLGSFAIARFTVDGHLDNSFSEDGKDVVDIENFETMTLSMALTNGKIMLGGISRRRFKNSPYYLLRYNSDGSLDNTLNGSGKLINYFPSSYTFNSRIFRNFDSTLSVVGITVKDAQRTVFVNKFASDGKRDSSYNVNLPIFQNLFSTCQQSGDKIVVCGNNFTHDKLLFVRLNGDGTVDTTFGQKGTATEDIRYNGFMNVQGLANKKLALTYGVFDYTTFKNSYHLKIFDKDGKTDLAFGQDGIVNIPIHANSISEQTDGKILLSGSSVDNSKIVLARYHSDGSIDNSFGTAGIVEFDLGENEYAYKVLLDDEGSITVLNSVFKLPNQNSRPVVIKLSPNGIADAGFGEKGFLWLDDALYNHQTGLLQNGKLVIAGSYIEGNETDLKFSVFNTDGSIDSTFGINGVVKSKLSSSNDVLSDLLVNGDQLLLAANSQSPSLSNPASVGFIAAYTFKKIIYSLKSPHNIVASTESGKCSAKVSDIDPVVQPQTASVNYSLSGATVGSGTGAASGMIFNKGVTTVTYTLQNDTTKKGGFTVTVLDDEAPTVSNLTATPDSLWPPDHTMRAVEVLYTTKDNCNTPQCKVSISSSEPTTGTNPNDLSPDWEVIDEHHIRLRAERSATNKARIYTITTTCTDSAGNASTKTTEVKVLSSNAQQELAIETYSNPTSGSFKIKVASSNADDKITLLVSDANGRNIEAINNLSPFEIISFGSGYQPGLYYIKITCGDKQCQLKLIKL